MNVFKNNTAPAANGVAVCKKLGRFAPAAALKAIAEIGATVDRIEAERAKWLRPAAEAAIKARRDLATREPTQKNLEALSVETCDDLMRRYAEAAEELFAVKAEAKRPLHPHYLSVLDSLRTALGEHTKALQAENAAASASWGIIYDPLNDAILLSLARFMDVAEVKLNNPNCICDVTEFKDFLGLSTKPAGILS